MKSSKQRQCCPKNILYIFILFLKIFNFIIYYKYSKHPNTEPRSVFEFNLMPVPTIQISNRPKTGRRVRFASIYRFIKKIAIKNILYMPKRSRLAVKNVRSGFQMVETKWPPPFEIRTNSCAFASIDRFINKSHKKYFFMPKWSRLAKNPVRTYI